MDLVVEGPTFLTVMGCPDPGPCPSPLQHLEMFPVQKLGYHGRGILGICPDGYKAQRTYSVLHVLYVIGLIPFQDQGGGSTAPVTDGSCPIFGIVLFQYVYKG